MLIAADAAFRIHKDVLITITHSKRFGDGT